MCHIVEFSCPGCAGHVGPEFLPCVHHHRSIHVHHPVRQLTFDALIARGFYRCTNAGCLLNPDIHKALMALHVAADARGTTYTQAGFAYTAARDVAEGVAHAAAAANTSATTTTATSDASEGPSSHMDEDHNEEDEACELALSDTEEARADEARDREARRRRHQQRKSEKTSEEATAAVSKTARFADTLSVFREDGSGTVATLPVRWGPGRVRRTFGRGSRPTRNIS